MQAENTRRGDIWIQGEDTSGSIKLYEAKARDSGSGKRPRHHNKTSAGASRPSSMFRERFKEELTFAQCQGTSAEVCQVACTLDRGGESPEGITRIYEERGIVRLSGDGTNPTNLGGALDVCQRIDWKASRGYIMKGHERVAREFGFSLGSNWEILIDFT